MRIDERGNPDVCRVQYTPVSMAAKAMSNQLKMQLNQMIADLGKLATWNKEPEVRRLLAQAMADLENAGLHGAKAILSENFLCVDPSPGGQAPNPSTAEVKLQG